MTCHKLTKDTLQRAKLFEFYLFINPLDPHSYHACQVLRQLNECVASKIEVNVVCYNNLSTVSALIQQRQLPLTLATRNDVFQQSYEASLAFKAASLQGKRKGRQFLMALQALCVNALPTINEALLIDIATSVKLDVPQFLSDYYSDDVHDFYLEDQKIASDMHIVSAPSLVIFEHYLSDNGVIIDSHITFDNVMAHLEYMLHPHSTALKLI